MLGIKLSSHLVQDQASLPVSVSRTVMISLDIMTSDIRILLHFSEMQFHLKKSPFSCNYCVG